MIRALAKFVNKAADGGITVLHMAVLNGYFDYAQLLLDDHANVSAAIFHYGASNGFNRSKKHSFAICCLWEIVKVLTDPPCMRCRLVNFVLLQVAAF